MNIKIAIADDDILIRESLKIILGSKENIEVVGTFENGQVLLNYLEENQVDIALLDVRMPVLNGVDTTYEIVKRGHRTKVVILTTFDEEEYINKVIRYGAKGYILKNNTPEQIFHTIQLVNSGISAIQEDVLQKVKLYLNDEDKSSFDRELFTERELEIMGEIAKGLSNKEISGKLFISEGTVKNYITSILNKTQLNHRTQIAIYYLKRRSI